MWVNTIQSLGLVSSEEAAQVPGRIRTTTSLQDTVADADYVIEAVNEDLSLKNSIFSQLDQFAPEHSILASNSSSFMPSQLAPGTQRGDRVLVAHYFNPPYLLPLVEVVRGPDTSTETIEAVYSLLSNLGKRPVILQKEAPGFIANRLQVALMREAISIVEKGIASPEDVDLAVRNGFGRRQAVAGPFEVSDAGGWDVNVAALTQLLPDIESSAEVPSIVKDMVERGDLGVKTGKGFYRWSRESAAELRHRIGQALVAIERLSSSA